MSSGITLGPGITLAQGISLTVAPSIVLSLDARSYSGSGTTWPSTVGPSATLYNAPAYTSGSVPYFSFDPNSLQYADTPNIGDLSNWTVEVWFEATSSLASALITALLTTVYDDNLGNHYGVINYTLCNYIPNTQNQNVINVGYFNGNWDNTNSATPTLDQWTHLVGTFDGTNMNYYINGVLFTTQPGDGASSANGGPVRIMRRWDGDVEAGYLCPGNVSIVNIYSGAMTPPEVTYAYSLNAERFGL
jgi:hypothetical protein